MQPDEFLQSGHDIPGDPPPPSTATISPTRHPPSERPVPDARPPASPNVATTTLTARDVNSLDPLWNRVE